MDATNLLRDYQHEILNRVRKSFKSGNRRVMLQSPTGSGKSIMAASMIEQSLAKGNPVGFIVERIQLADQMSQHLSRFGIDHHVMQGDHPMWNPDAPVTVATIQTLARRKAPDCRLWIVDEAHITFATHVKLMEQYSNCYFLGLSATPWAKGLANHWEDLVVGSTVGELVKMDYLVDTEVYAPSSPDVSRIKITKGDYDVTALSQSASDKVLIGDIVDHWSKLSEGRKTICFAVDIAHSKSIVEQFTRAGITAAHLDAYSDQEQRAHTIEAFQKGKIDILSSVDLLGRGFDVPDVGCVIMARPTRSLMVYMQQVGRGLRIADGKTNCIVLDHAGNTARHGFVTDEFPAELCDGKKDLDHKHAQEKEEKLPKACPSCHYMKPAGTHICPSCGFAAERKTAIKEESGELVKLKKKNKYEHLTKQEAYSQLLSLQLKYGYQHGWTAHKYREMFGVWPKGLLGEYSQPSIEVINFVKASNIRRHFADIKRHA